jgi:hypothetical protein
MENSGSLREPPQLDVSVKLLWQFAADGFMTTGDAVLVRLKDMGIAPKHIIYFWNYI